MRRLFSAWYMKRLLTQMPAPCSRCWVTVALKFELRQRAVSVERDCRS